MVHDYMGVVRPALLLSTVRGCCKAYFGAQVGPVLGAGGFRPTWSKMDAVTSDIHIEWGTPTGFE